MRAHLHSPLALALVAILALGMAACGGGGGEPTTSGGQPAPTPGPAREKAMAKAEANCHQMLKEVKSAAGGVLSRGYTSNLKLVTLGFGRPGLRIARRMRERQQKLVTAIDSNAYETYVGLFDPIILYAERSINAAEAENLAASTELKEKLTTLGLEQGVVAQEAGLPACEVDFLGAMVKAATG